MGTAKTRQHKIEWMRKAVETYFNKKPAGTIDKHKLLAEFSIHNNSSERTGDEILRLLEKTNFIKVDDDEIRK